MFFDTYKEAEYSLVSEIKADKGVISSNEYIQEPEILSANTVKISGPTTEMNKIKTVVAHIQLDNPITNTQTFDATIIPRGEYDSTLQYLTVNGGKDNITITIPILKVKTLPTKVAFTNIPSYFIDHPLNVKCSPAYLRVAAAESIIDKMTYVTVGTVDFAQLGALKNTFTFNASSLNNIVVMDDVSKISAIVDGSGMTSAEFKIPKENIKAVNIPNGWKANIVQAEISSVSVVGNESAIASLQNKNIYADVDLAGVSLTEGTHKLPVRVYIKGRGDVWACGEYSVFVSLSKS